MQKLVSIGDKACPRGTVFRFPAKWPYESMVDLMLFSNPYEERPHGLIVTTGHKAGLVLVLLPRESTHPEGDAVSAAWLVSEWSKWIYPDCAVADVHVMLHYPAPGSASSG
jgi:hypothetical protein